MTSQDQTNADGLNWCQEEEGEGPRKWASKVIAPLTEPYPMQKSLAATHGKHFDPGREGNRRRH
jgi:hypothetical protein